MDIDVEILDCEVADVSVGCFATGSFASPSDLIATSGVLQNSIFSTGANLQTQLNLISGGAYTQLTGITVSGSDTLIDLVKITGINNVVTISGQTIVISGVPGGYSTSNPNNYSNSGNLYNTGNILLGLINTLSGQTGRILDGVVRTTGTQNIQGNKTFHLSNSLGRYFSVSGDTFIDNLLKVDGVLGYTYLKNLEGNDIVSTETLRLNRNPGTVSLDWENQFLADLLGTASLNWAERTLLDSASSVSADWNLKQLTGIWSTNTVPTQSGHLVNKHALNQSGAALTSIISSLPLSNAVFTTGNQNINGDKTFLNGLNVSGDLTIQKTGTVLSDNSPFVISTTVDENNTATTALYIYPRDSANHRIFLGTSSKPVYSLNLSHLSAGIESLAQMQADRFYIGNNGNTFKLGAGNESQYETYWSSTFKGLIKNIPSTSPYTTEAVDAAAFQFIHGGGDLSKPNLVIYNAQTQTGHSLVIKDAFYNTLAYINNSGEANLRGLNVSGNRPTYNNSGLATTGEITRKYTTYIGNGNSTGIVVTHGLGTDDITWSCRATGLSGNYDFIFPSVFNSGAGNLVFGFASGFAPQTNEYRVTIIG